MKRARVRGRAVPRAEAKGASEGEQQRLLLRLVVKHNVRGKHHRQQEHDDGDIDEGVELIHEAVLVRSEVRGKHEACGCS